MIDSAATRDTAEALDAQDELTDFRQEFVIAEPELIYLDGNSLGRLAHKTASQLEKVVNDAWGRGLIRGWNENWFAAPQRVGEKIAQLLGAGPGQIIVSDTTSINLFKLVMAALSARPGRYQIISDRLNFPSDLYILQGCIELLGEQHHLDLVPSKDDILPDLAALEAMIGPQTALVTLSHVVFKSGYLYDAQAITERAHRAGALVLWDLSHAAGAVPVELDAWNVDLAVGCTYKYLNGGPGSPAYLYVRNDLQEALHSPIWGWWGQRSPFDFGLDFSPASGIDHFLVSSPPVLSMLAMEPAVEVLLQAGMARLRRKSVAQTEYMIRLSDHFLAPLGFILGSPRAAERRGSHISLRHAEGYRINRALIEDMALIPDFRAPDNLRLGIAPIYTRYTDIWEAVQRIRQVVEAGMYRKFSAERLAVT
jgi:kynureninase